VQGGIKAQTRRGGFAREWWGKRWIEVLESFQIGARLVRGRSYARRGQVADLDIRKGEIRARVQGSRSEAYQVTIRLKRINRPGWKKIAESLKKRPIHLARLLSGNMPQAMEEIFEENRLSLFPERHGDLRTECSCPDWSNPCKHIAAVYYLLAEQFDNDPFLLFRIRGMGRKAFFDLLEEGSLQGKETISPASDIPNAMPDPLPQDPMNFWNPEKASFAGSFDADIPLIPAVLPKRLGPFPFWRGERDLAEELEIIYDEASSSAYEMVSSEQDESMD
jgi:uncharacterized Zn finger protein